MSQERGCPDRVVGLAAMGENVDSAVDAEQVTDRVLVEQIVARIVLAGTALKAFRRHSRSRPFRQTCGPVGDGVRERI